MVATQKDKYDTPEKQIEPHLIKQGFKENDLHIIVWIAKMKHICYPKTQM